MALVELYRVTGERRATSSSRRRLIERRGHGLLGAGRFGPAYWQDTLPVREAPDGRRPRGAPAVPRRGAVDVAVETGDAELLDARPCAAGDDMVATRTYLTGGLGSRHATRRSATRSSCRPTGRTPRPAPRSPA